MAELREKEGFAGAYEVVSVSSMYSANYRPDAPAAAPAPVEGEDEKKPSTSTSSYRRNRGEEEEAAPAPPQIPRKRKRGELEEDEQWAADLLEGKGKCSVPSSIGVRCYHIYISF